MPLLNDDNLDKLSREAADQYDVEPSISGWEGLEQRLNKELPQERRRRRLLFWWFFVGVLLLGGALWSLKPWHSGENENTADTAPADNRSISSIQNHTPGPSAESLNPPGNKRNKWLNPTGAISKLPGNIRQNQPIFVAEKPQLSGLTTPNLPVNKFPNTPHGKTEQQLTGKIETVTSSNPVLSSSTSDSPEKPGKKPTPPTSITDSTDQPATNSTQTRNQQTKPLNLSSRKGTFYITALAGLDLSNVKFSTAGNAGFNGGLQIGYYFTDKLSIYSGILYNRKNYKARGKDFTAKVPLSYYDIDKVVGWCAMLDIPLNIRYDIGIRKKSRYFLSAGVSSYLMDKEDYDYYFYNLSGNYTERNWNTDDNSNYLFSILNFCAGAELRLGKNFFLEAEPYLKLPVKGVGRGEIRLNSFGINFGLKYQLGKQRKK